MNATVQTVSLQTRLKTMFEEGFPVPADTEHHLREALFETLRRPGNFIRAQLAYSVARAYALREEDAQHLAIAMEYFHTASLIFDDLPSMDDATHRRGHLCVHHLYGEGTAILAALGFINRAYGLLWKAVASASATHQAAALTYVEKYLGLGGLLSGQSYDLRFSKMPLTDRDPQRVAMGKTVSLIRLSLVLPAIVSGEDQRTTRLLDRLAVLWGLAYQAIDDLKDVLHGSEATGKTTARDTLLDRPNLVLTLGKENTIVRLRKLIRLGDRLVVHLQQLQSSLTCLDVPRLRLATEVRALTTEVAGSRR